VAIFLTWRFELANPGFHVRYGSKADIEASPPDVRFTPKSGHRALLTTRPSLDSLDHDSGPAQKRAVFVPLIGAACAAIAPCKCLILPNVVPPKADIPRRNLNVRFGP
jgi:hypothetical protein